MSELAVSPDQQPVVVVTSALTRNRRLLALAMVLAVSFSNYIVTSTHSAIWGQLPLEPSQRPFRILLGLVGQAVSLLLLWFVLSEQGRSSREIGWTPKWADIVPGVGLIVATKIVGFVVNMLFQVLYKGYMGHYLQPKPIHTLLDSGISVLSLLYVLANPFFEELIVRAYTMSEVVGVGGSKALAITVSVVIQMSYHSYQGLLRGVGLVAAFSIFSIYFSRTRRIGPVIIAHFYADAYGLIRSSF